MNNKHIGSNFDDFLKEEGIDLEEMNGAFANFIQVVKLLAGQYLSLKAENEKLKKEMNAKVFLLMGEDLNFWKKLKTENIRLESENHALRQCIKDFNIIRLSEKYEQYKQALEDIREITESIYQICDDECGNASRLKIITDKINEVLKDE